MSWISQSPPGSVSTAALDSVMTLDFSCPVSAETCSVEDDHQLRRDPQVRRGHVVNLLVGELARGQDRVEHADRQSRGLVGARARPPSGPERALADIERDRLA